MLRNYIPAELMSGSTELLAALANGLLVLSVRQSEGLFCILSAKLLGRLEKLETDFLEWKI